MMDTPYLTWLLLLPLIASLVLFAARWLGAASRLVVQAVHLLSVTLVLVAAFLTVRQVITSGPIFSLRNWLHVDELSAIFLLIIGVVGFLVGIYSIGYTRHDLESGEFDDNKLSTVLRPVQPFPVHHAAGGDRQQHHHDVGGGGSHHPGLGFPGRHLRASRRRWKPPGNTSSSARWAWRLVCMEPSWSIPMRVNVMQVPGSAVLWTEIVKNTQALDPTLIKMAFVFVLGRVRDQRPACSPCMPGCPMPTAKRPARSAAMLSGVLLNCALLVIFRFATITNLVYRALHLRRRSSSSLARSRSAAAAFFMYVQRDIKRLLAYSSMENIGLIVLAFGMGGPVGIIRRVAAGDQPQPGQVAHVLRLRQHPDQVPLPQPGQGEGHAAGHPGHRCDVDCRCDGPGWHAAVQHLRQQVL